MIDFIKKFFQYDTNKCFSDKQKRTDSSWITPDGRCGGQYGGDRFTDNLEYCCIDCPHYKGF